MSALARNLLIGGINDPPGLLTGSTADGGPHAPEAALPLWVMSGWSDGQWGLVAAVVGALLGTVAGFLLSAWSANRAWKRQRETHLLDRTIELAEEIHVLAAELASVTHQGVRPNRLELMTRGRLLVARAKASDPHLSEVLDDVLDVVRESTSLEQDRVAATAVAGTVAGWLLTREGFADWSAERLLAEAARE